MARILPHIESSVLIGVGAAFRFLLGQYRHPPKIVQRCGLEGVFWRARYFPIENIRWYCRSIPLCAWLMLKACRARSSRPAQGSSGRKGHG